MAGPVGGYQDAKGEVDGILALPEFLTIYEGGEIIKNQRNRT